MKKELEVYKFREFYIPPRMMEGLQRYINSHIKPGSFLLSVLCNDLAEAVMNADDENLGNIPAYVSYLYNKTPRTCWGSEEKVANWLSGR